MNRQQKKSSLPRATSLAVALLTLVAVVTSHAAGESVSRLLIDRNHGGFYQKGDDGWRIQNLKSVAQEIGVTVADVDQELTSGILTNSDILYIGVVTMPYSQGEKDAVLQFVKDGGSLCLVMEEDYWCKLEETGVNDLIAPFGMKLSETIDSKQNCGAIAKTGLINKSDREIPYSGGRHVTGGNPFSFINNTDGLAHAAYKQLPGGGKIVVMGDAMACLLMGDGKSVRLSEDGYWGKDSRVFLQEVLTWLTHRNLSPPTQAANTVITPDLTKIAAADGWTVFNRTLDPAQEATSGVVFLNAAPGDGLAWVNGIEFSEGTLELEIKGKNQPGRSFVGLAFHGQDNQTFDAVYLRPFNFQSAERSSHSIQYISVPEHDWSELRSNHPGKYEAALTPAPEPESWVKLKLVIEGKTVSAFVNGANEPALKVGLLNDRPKGKVGLWVGNGSDGWFRNLKVMSARE